MTATMFLASIQGMDRPTRERAFLEALLGGHVPESMRTFVPFDVPFTDAQGQAHTLTIQVLQDYLTIGTNNDRFRTPLNPLTAQWVADAWNCIFPTYHLVDLIWHAAVGKVPAQPWGPPYDASMMSTDRMHAQNVKIEATMRAMGIDMASLVAGHKKDVILTTRFEEVTKSVSIYGWMQPNGAPIQGLPLFLGHENTYADYSHGNRMVSRVCILDGDEDDLGRIMLDPVLSVAVSKEGPFTFIRQPEAV
jgi:hypothetical protein